MGTFVLSFRLFVHEANHKLGVRVERLRVYLANLQDPDVEVSCDLEGQNIDVRLSIRAPDRVAALAFGIELLAEGVIAVGGIPMFGDLGATLRAEADGHRYHWSNRWVLITVPDEPVNEERILRFSSAAD